MNPYFIFNLFSFYFFDVYFNSDSSSSSSSCQEINEIVPDILRSEFSSSKKNIYIYIFRNRNMCNDFLERESRKWVINFGWK